jgi:hypothetical protein
MHPFGFWTHSGVWSENSFFSESLRSQRCGVGVADQSDVGQFYKWRGLFLRRKHLAPPQFQF